MAGFEAPRVRNERNAIARDFSDRNRAKVAAIEHRRPKAAFGFVDVT